MTPSPDPTNSWRTALLFDGKSYVALTKPLPAMSAGVTIEFWAFGADDLPQATILFASWKDERWPNLHQILLPWYNNSISWDTGREVREKARTLT